MWQASLSSSTGNYHSHCFDEEDSMSNRAHWEGTWRKNPDVSSMDKNFLMRRKENQSFPAVLIITSETYASYDFPIDNKGARFYSVAYRLVFICAALTARYVGMFSHPRTCVCR